MNIIYFVVTVILGVSVFAFIRIHLVFKMDIDSLDEVSRKTRKKMHALDLEALEGFDVCAEYEALNGRGINSWRDLFSLTKWTKESMYPEVWR